MLECCILCVMLARFLLIVMVCISGFAKAEQERPHVFVIQLNATEVKSGAELDFIKPEGWAEQSGSCLASPGRAAVQTALLFGTPALEQGVVADADWRRKAVRGETLANLFKNLGYQACFYGAWALGVNEPFEPQSRGFDRAYAHTAALRNTLTDRWEKSGEAPLEIESFDQSSFVYIAEGRKLSRASIMDALSKWAEKNQHPAIVVILESGGDLAQKYYHPARWQCFTRGVKKSTISIETDWDLHRLICDMVGLKVSSKSAFRFFHYGNWPVTESAERNRHRGSLVIGEGLALVNGINLYRAKGFAADLVQPLDLVEHQQMHRQLLTAHGQWWQLAGKALHDTRAFDVGQHDGRVVRLSALDWRASKIIDVNGESPNSMAMVYQDDLLAILGGLKNNPKYKDEFPAYSGSWAVNITRSGRYKITASLLPSDTANGQYKELMKLAGGTAFIRLGGNVAQLKVMKGATSVTLQMDADAGIIDMECWFTGQLALTRELGAFFVEIERVSDKKFDLKAKAAE